MFPPQFDYHRAGSVDEALELLAAREEEDARVLAGGHSLLTEVKNRRSSPDALVDVGGIDSLRGIDVGEGETTIGALTTYAAVLDSSALRERAPAFAEATARIGDIQIRNRGTVGGNLAQADPEGDLPAAALASDATIAVCGPDGERTVDAEEFFRGPRETVVDDGELVTEIRIPHAAGRTGAYVKKTHPASGYAMVGVAAVLETAVEDGGTTIVDARIAVNGVANLPTQLSAVADRLVDENIADLDADTLEMAAERAGADLDSSTLLSDHHASGEYRTTLLPSYVERALERALERANGGSDAETAVATDGGEGR